MFSKSFEFKYFAYIYIFLFLLLPQLKILNLKINIFDTGVYLVNLYNMVENNNYFGILNGHFQPVLFFVSLILRLNFTYADHIILLLQSTILLIPFIFLKYKKNENAYLYLFFFPLWLINLNGFHTDSFIYPLFFLYLLEKEPKNKIFYCLSFILIKEIYLILTCLCLFEIIFLTKKRRKKLILSIFFILLILITGYFLAHILPKHSQQVTYFRSQEINQNQVLIHSIIKEFYNYLKIIDLNKILYAALIFLPVLFIPLINKKFLFFYIPFFFIYTIIPGPNFLKPQFHYSTIFIPLILFFFTSSNIFNKKLGSFFLISNLLIIILSFANIGNLNLFRNYDFKNYVNIDNKNKLDLFFNDLTFNKEEVIATNNNLNYKYFFQRNLIIVQDLHGQDFLKSRELCKVLTEKQLKKAKKLSDKICEVYADKIFFTNNYISNLSNKEMNTVNKKYNIYKKNEIYTLYNTKK
jgi:hypothetical protein